MTAGSLVPITREVLRQFYAQYPLTPVPKEELELHHKNVDTQTQRLSAKYASEADETQQRFFLETPARLDDNFWRIRMLSEEIALSLEGLSKKHPELSQQLSACKQTLLDAERSVSNTQKRNTEAAAIQVKQFLPQDFRAAFVESRRAAKETNNTKAVEDLVKRGGSIRERYELLMKQQWERRESLVQLGTLSGIYKFLIKYLGGVPQVLLDFAKEINAKIGPLEEQRIKYGPDIYAVTTLGVCLNVLAALWLETADMETLESSKEIWGILRPGIEFYCHHLVRVFEFLGHIFDKSPFFVTKDDVERAVAATSQSASQRSESLATASRNVAQIREADIVLEQFSPDPNEGRHVDTVLAKLSYVGEGTLAAARAPDARSSASSPAAPAFDKADGIPFSTGQDAGAVVQQSGVLTQHQGSDSAACGFERRRSTGEKEGIRTCNRTPEVAVLVNASGMSTRKRPAHVAVGGWNQQPEHGNIEKASATGSDLFMSCAENNSTMDEDASPASALADLHGFGPLSRHSPPLAFNPLQTHSHLHPNQLQPPQQPAAPPPIHTHAPGLPPLPPPHPASTSTSLHVHNPSRGGGSSVSSSSSCMPGLAHALSEGTTAGAAAACEQQVTLPSPLTAAVSQSSITLTSMSSLSQPPAQQLQARQSLLTQTGGGWACASTGVREGGAAQYIGTSPRTSHMDRPASMGAVATAATGGEASSVTAPINWTMTGGTEAGEDGSSLGSLSQPGAGGPLSDIATVGSPKPYGSSVGLASVLEEENHPGKRLSSLNSMMGGTPSELHAQDGMALPPSRLSTQSPMHHHQQQGKQQLGPQARAGQKRQAAQSACCLMQ